MTSSPSLRYLAPNKPFLMEPVQNNGYGCQSDFFHAELCMHVTHAYSAIIAPQYPDNIVFQRAQRMDITTYAYARDRNLGTAFNLRHKYDTMNQTLASCCSIAWLSAE